MRALLHRIFAAVRFVQIEWVMWLEEQNEVEHETPASAPDAPIDPLEARIADAEIDIREGLRNGGASMLTDQQIRSAAVGFVDVAIRREKEAAERKARAENGR
jgi:hypothetical protein